VPGFARFTFVWAGALLVATLVDYLLLPGADRIEVVRVVEPELSLGATHTVELEVRNRDNRPWRITVHDEPPDSIPNDFSDTALRLGANRQASVTYNLHPKARGDFEFGDVWFRVTGRLGLISRDRRVPARAHV